MTIGQKSGATGHCFGSAGQWPGIYGQKLPGIGHLLGIAGKEFSLLAQKLPSTDQDFPPSCPGLETFFELTTDFFCL
jgi:hypothetical protein